MEEEKELSPEEREQIRIRESFAGLRESRHWYGLQALIGAYKEDSEHTSGMLELPSHSGHVMRGVLKACNELKQEIENQCDIADGKINY